MAKQIILTQNDYGIELETQFVNDKKKPLDITDYDVRAKIIYNNETIDTILAGHKDNTNGIAYIVLEKEHLLNAGLYTTVWSVVDEDEHITAQENLYYFVKDLEGSEDNDTPTTDLPIDADVILNKFKEVDDNLFELNEQKNLVNETIDITNQAINNINANLDNITKKSLYYITPEMFTLNVETDDTGRIQRAINYAKNKSLDIKFGCKKYNTSKPLEIYSSTRLIGTQSNMSSGTGTYIINTDTDMLKIIMEDTLASGLTVNTNIHFDGILWRGSLTQDTKNKFIANTDTVYVNWGDIKNCGFRGFIDVFNDIKFTGFYVHNIVFYDCNTLGKIGGSDNSFYHWMVNSTETNINRKDYLIKLIDFEVSTVEDIFITGALDTGNGCKSILYMERVRACSLDHLILDYSDYYALYMTSCTGNTFKNGFVRGNARASDSTYVIYIGHNCNSNKIYNNYFSVVHKGVEKNKNAKIYFIDSTSTKNKIYNNKYDAGIGGLTYDAGQNAIYIIDEPSENIVVIKDSNYRKTLLTQYSQQISGLLVNFEKYPNTVHANSKLEIPSLINIDLPRGCVYKVVFDNLPDGLSVYDTVYDGSKISIRLKNDSNDNVTLNTNMTYSINYFSLS